MSQKTVSKSYLDWAPTLKPEEVFSQSVTFAFVSVDEKGRLYWVENRPEEGGRSVIVMMDESGNQRDVIPKPFSARSRVLEYGGNPYVADREKVYFVNNSDQRIYKVDLTDLNRGPTPLTTEKTKSGELGKYLELKVSPDGRWLVFVYEKEISGKEPIDEIGVLNLQNTELQEAHTLAAGADFYKSPQFSPDGHSLAWLEWNHPLMPWDSTFLYQASFHSGAISEKKRIAGSDKSSIPGFCYTKSGSLVFSADFAGKGEESFENFANLYSYKNKKTVALTRESMDFQQIRCEGENIYAQVYRQGQAHLVVVNAISRETHEIQIKPVAFSAPFPYNDKIYLVGSLSQEPSQLLEIEASGAEKVIKKSSTEFVDPSNVSQAQLISFKTADGEKAYGYFYPPVNSKYQAPEKERPPVRVLIHGGPTSLTQPGFSKQLQFWTSQGYAVFDVNYRGSVGFGRRFRDLLKKKWGIAEIEDVFHGLQYLREKNLISDQAVVSGGSAGGYTVQRLLTFYPDLFATGASHFGIGNLVTLQKLTHKFESHYLEGLIGGTLDTNLREFQDRSPINHLDKLKSPMVIFQGSEDKVVPPENSREMAEILKKKNIICEYHEYPDEGHGFRKKENMVDALEKESLFFKKVLKNKK